MRFPLLCAASLLASTVLPPATAQAQRWSRDGYVAGAVHGYHHGYGDGYDDGQGDGYQDGYVDGGSRGYDDGHGQGYRDGYVDARRAARPRGAPCRATGSQGAILGAVGGGLGGHLLAGEDDKLIGTLLGALAGGVAGDAIHRRDRCR